MKILLLEDDLNRVREFEKRVSELNENSLLVHTKTAIDCINKLKTDKFELILLDHDLGGEIYVDSNREDTGSEVARWISNNRQSVNGAIIITHSYNIVGAKNIIDLIPNAIHVPSIWTKEIFHKTILIKK